MNPRTPFSRSYWIEAGKLLAGYYPGDADPVQAQAKLDSLLDTGIRTVVNLMELDEYGYDGNPFVHYDDTFSQLAERRGISVRCIRRPIPDMTAPPPHFMKAILDDIDMSIADGAPVYLHCRGGLGRTGAVVGCWLARHNIATGKAVFEHISFLRRNEGASHRRSPQTDEQCALVEMWQAGY